jgi:hypothetical protein
MSKWVLLISKRGNWVCEIHLSKSNFYSFRDYFLSLINTIMITLLDIPAGGNYVQVYDLFRFKGFKY